MRNHLLGALAALWLALPAAAQDPQTAGWRASFENGVAAYQRGEKEQAAAYFRAANEIAPRVPDGHYNLAVILGEGGDVPGAIEEYAQALTLLTGLAPSDEHASERADIRRGALSGLVVAGVARHEAGDYALAEKAFRKVTEAEPRHRDGWYNLTLALYQQQRWAELVPVAGRLVALDPLNDNARVLLYNAHKGLYESGASPASREAALSVLGEADTLPVHVSEVAVTPSEGGVTISGKATGRAATEGSPVTLAFTLHGDAGEAGSGAVELQAPARNVAAPFSITVPVTGPVVTWSYRPVGAP